MNILYFSEDTQMIDEITGSDSGPENLLLSLVSAGYPTNVLPTETVTFLEFEKLLIDTQTHLGRLPHVVACCASGLFRSKVLAKQIADLHLAVLSSVNLESDGTITGYGYNTILNEGLATTSEGIFAHPQDQSPIDVFILAFDTRMPRAGDRAVLTLLAERLDRGVREQAVSHIPSIIWVQGNEEQIEQWISSD